MPPHRRRSAALLPLLLALVAPPVRAAWNMHAGNAQHTAQSTVPTQPLQAVRWQTPVDVQPQYTGSILYIHYGSPLITEANTVIVPVKTGVSDTFRVEARRALDGALLWQLASDYTLPPHNWVPPFSPARAPKGALYVPAAGGTLLRIADPDSPTPAPATRIAFFGNAAYAANTAAMNASLRICTPLTVGDDGTVWFGIHAVVGNPLGISNGLAAVDANGNGRFVSVASFSGGTSALMALNAAPALSRDGSLVYVAVRGVSTTPGRLFALATSDLSTQASTSPTDPLSNFPLSFPSDATSTPLVAPDDRVYFGAFGNPFLSNEGRGWLLQFDKFLNPTGAPGAFGWDQTPSVVPTSAIPGYAGSAPYLLMSKYNFYAGFGAGDGKNRLAILDPDASHVDAITGAVVMNEVRSILGPTLDPDLQPDYPGAVKEWCINTAAVDPFDGSVLAGSEDGKLYRWQLASNTFSESVVLTPGLGEAYTPTAVGPDGTVYAINNATLFAVGSVGAGAPPRAPRTALTALAPNPFVRATGIRFTLAATEDVRAEVYAVNGKRVVTLAAGRFAAGEHVLHWDGSDDRGALSAPGVYLLRFHAGDIRETRRLVHLR